MKLKKIKKNLPRSPRPRIPEDERLRQVFSYRSVRSSSDAPTGRYETREKLFSLFFTRLRQLHIPTIVATLGVIISVGYILGLSTSPRIVFIQASHKNLLQEPTVYQAASEALLKRSIMSRTKLTINTTSFALALKQQFPELGSVTVVLPLVDRHPVLQLSARMPAMVLVTQNGFFVLDDTGHAMLQSSKISDFKALQIPIANDESHIPVRLEDAILSVQDVSFIVNVAAQLAAQHVAIESLSLPIIPNELHLKEVGQGYYVKLNTQSDPRLAIGTYLAVKQKLQADHVTPTEYIDVRVDEKAYYK